MFKDKKIDENDQCSLPNLPNDVLELWSTGILIMATRPERHLWVSSKIRLIRIDGLLGSK